LEPSTATEDLIVIAAGHPWREYSIPGEKSEIQLRSKFLANRFN
jgi:hypothetical protein